MNSIHQQNNNNNPVIQDLLQALYDDELIDIYLKGYDGLEIGASKFVLASRSSVLRRMLYGNFKEATSTVIEFNEYDSVIVEAIVEYCYYNKISKFRISIHRTSTSARKLVQLYKAADYLALGGLATLVVHMVHNLTTRYPPLACAVYDEADVDSKISKDALEMIISRPYVTLPPNEETDGGIICLSNHKLITLYANLSIQCGELFLFYILQEWLKYHNDDENGDNDVDDDGRGAASPTHSNNTVILNSPRMCFAFSIGEYRTTRLIRNCESLRSGYFPPNHKGDNTTGITCLANESLVLIQSWPGRY